MPLPSEAPRASHSSDEIDEYAFVVVLQIGQVVGEVGLCEGVRARCRYPWHGCPKTPTSTALQVTDSVCP